MNKFKKIFTLVICLIFCLSFSAKVWAQIQSEAERLPLRTPKKTAERVLPESPLAGFDALEISGDIDLRLIEVEAGKPLKLIYDLGEVEADKFRFSIKRDGVLEMSTNNTVKNLDRVQVTLYYRGLNRIKASKSKIEFESPYSAKIADIKLDYEARLTGFVDCDDLYLDLGSESKINIAGEVRFLTVEASSSASAELRNVKNMSADISCSSGAVVALTAGERLKTNLSTGALIKYKGEARILRTNNSLLGGSLVRLE